MVMARFYAMYHSFIIIKHINDHEEIDFKLMYISQSQGLLQLSQWLWFNYDTAWKFAKSLVQPAHMVWPVSGSRASINVKTFFTDIFKRFPNLCGGHSRLAMSE